MSQQPPFGNEPQDPRPPQGPPYQGPYQQPGSGGSYPPGSPGGYGQPGQPGQPYGMGSGPGGPTAPGGPGGPQQPYGGYAPIPPQQPKKSGSKTTLIIIGAVVLALIVIGVTAGVLLSRRSPTATPGPNDPGGTGGTTSAPAPATKASDAVKTYLDALAAGDAATAIAMAKTAPADKTFLTNEVLAESNKLAPLTDINVPEVADEYAYQVAASYKLGDQAVSENITVAKAGDSWKVSEVAADIDIGTLRNKTLPLNINGVAAKTDKIALFPGAYELSSGSANIAYGSGGSLLVQSPSDYPRGLYDMRPQLTDAGDKAFTKVVTSNVKTCLKSDELKNPGCPNNVTGKVTGCKPKDGTIEWNSTADLDNIKPRLESDNPAVASAFMSLGLSAEGDYQGGKCRVTLFRSPQPSVNMTQEPLKVVWTS